MTPAISRRRTKIWDDSQPDLFIALPSDIPARDQQDLMERPFFSLSKNKRTTPIEYEVGGNYICVTANEKYGIATIWDADILIWAASQITEALSKGLKTSRFFWLSAYDLLTFIRRGTSGRDYQELKAALDRLKSTSVVTSIRQGKRKERHHFSWLNEWKEITNDQGRSLGLEFILPDWLYDGIINQQLVLSIDPAYFDPILFGTNFARGRGPGRDIVDSGSNRGIPRTRRPAWLLPLLLLSQRRPSKVSSPFAYSDRSSRTCTRLAPSGTALATGSCFTTRTRR
jgi:plasmid replication initiation protein